MAILHAGSIREGIDALANRNNKSQSERERPWEKGDSRQAHQKFRTGGGALEL